MILLINGPFGVGKTTCAKQLRKQIPRSAILDPERIGFVLQRIIRADDYQDVKFWRKSVVIAARIYRILFSTVIIPMTLWREDYRNEIVAGLSKIDYVQHIVLIASTDTIRTRIASRKQRGAIAWSLMYLDRCQEAFARTNPEEWVETNGIGMEDVAGKVVERIIPNERSSRPG